MLADNWKALIEAALSGAGRDLNDMVSLGAFLSKDWTRRGRQSCSARPDWPVLHCVWPFPGGDEDKRAGGRFVGIMFMMVAMAAGLGWMASGSAP